MNKEMLDEVVEMDGILPVATEECDDDNIIPSNEDFEKNLEILEKDEDVKDTIHEFEKIREKAKILEDRILKYTDGDVDNLAEKDVDYIIGEDTLEMMKKQGLPLDLEFKRYFIKYLINELNLQKNMIDFKKDMKELQSKLDKNTKDFIENMHQINILHELEDKIKNAETEEEKKKYMVMHSSISNALYLDNLVKKINNKGVKQIIKEANKNFEQTKKKATRIMKSDAKMYLNPEHIDKGIEYILGDSDKEYGKIISYLVYRELICKKKSKVPVETNMFVNYFIMNIRKYLSLAEGQEDENVNVFVSKLHDLVELLKTK